MKILLFNWNNVLTDVEAELKKRGHEVLPLDGQKETFNSADVVVVWNETNLGGWRESLLEAQKQGKRTVLVQHGRRGTSRIYPPFNETLISDVACVWGENDRKRLESVGTDPTKIVVTGTSVLRYLKPKIPHKGFNVVYCPEHWDKDVVENFIVFDELKKLKVNLIVKCLKGEQIEDYYDNVVSSGRDDPDHLEVCADLLAKTDLVVGISESTFELLAEAMDIPVVIADCWIPKACDGDERYKEYVREYSNACTMAKLPELNKTVMKELKNPKRLKKERAEISITDGGTNIKNPVEEIIKVILNEK